MNSYSGELLTRVFLSSRSCGCECGMCLWSGIEFPPHPLISSGLLLLYPCPWTLGHGWGVIVVCGCDIAVPKCLGHYVYSYHWAVGRRATIDDVGVDFRSPGSGCAGWTAGIWPGMRSALDRDVPGSMSYCPIGLYIIPNVGLVFWSVGPLEIYPGGFTSRQSLGGAAQVFG
jgi:hypothetical protein